jgi:entericidin B
MKVKNFPALAALSLVLATLGLAACNTVEGAGQDLKAGGQAIENSADRTKNY